MITSTFIRRALGASLLAALAGGSGAGHAWVQDTECGAGDEYTSDHFTFKVSTVDFPTPGDLHTALSTVEDLWDGGGFPIGGTTLDVDYNGTTTVGTDAEGDSVESVTIEDFGPTVMGHANDYCSGSRYVECDIRLGDEFSFHDEVPMKGEVGWSIGATFLHEIGHCLGFAHDLAAEDNMNPFYPFGGNIGGRISVGEASRVGVADMYPSSGAQQELSISILRMTSTAGQTNFIPFNAGGTNEATSAADGSSILRKYCIHNMGTGSLSSVSYKIYLSTDDLVIETTDTVLGSYAVNIAPNDPYCPERTVTIPLGAPAGTARIGAIIDPANAEVEYNESNNTATDADLFTVL